MWLVPLPCGEYPYYVVSTSLFASSGDNEEDSAPYPNYPDHVKRKGQATGSVSLPDPFPDMNLSRDEELNQSVLVVAATLCNNCGGSVFLHPKLVVVSVAVLRG